MRTVEAIIQPSGEVRLVEPVHVQSPRRALVTILEEEPRVQDAALLSEAALAEDWNRPEEDAAWAHLQRAKSS
jgi:nitrous oxide reductase accessory protein NosL